MLVCLELRLYHWAIGDLRTLAEGKDSQPGAPRAAEGGPKRRVWGRGGSRPKELGCGRGRAGPGVGRRTAVPGAKWWLP